MKKHILLSTLAAGLISIAPLNAAKIVSNYNTTSVTVTDEDKTKADGLAEKAFWIILLNSDNTDSLHSAIDLCNEAIELNPELADAFFNRADAKNYLGDYAGALVDFNIVIEKRGEARDFQYRGECKFNASDNEGALADYQTAFDKGYGKDFIQQLVGNSDANQLGIVFFNTKDYDKAVLAFTLSVNTLTTETNLFNRGNAEYMAGDHTAALVDWKRSGKMGNKDAKKSYRKFKKLE